MRRPPVCRRAPALTAPPIRRSIASGRRGLAIGPICTSGSSPLPTRHCCARAVKPARKRSYTSCCTMKRVGEMQTCPALRKLQARQCRSRRFLGGLENHRAAGGDGRTELAAGIADGEVPGCKGRDRPDRLADYGRPHAGGTHELASVKTVTLAGIELEERHVHHHFDARLGERLALLERRDARDLFLSLPE